MCEFSESNSIFIDSQFGFRRKLSCELALNTLVDDWKTSLDKRKSVIAVFLDLKLEHYGFSEYLCLLIANYLTERSFTVQFYGSRSVKSLFSMGVPQGSILGPLLFIL